MHIRSLRTRSIGLLVTTVLGASACGVDPAVAVPVGAQQVSVRGAGAASTPASQPITGGGGVTLATYEAGNPSGPPIVLIHGFTGNVLSWEHQFTPSLAAEFRLVAYDLRGHGASQKPLDGAAYTTADLWADDLHALIQAKNLDRPILVGWSYGGFVIADYVRKYGDDLLGGVVFVGATAKLNTEGAADHLTTEILQLFGDLLSPEVRTRLVASQTLVRMLGHSIPPGDQELAFGGAMMVPAEVRLGMFSRQFDNDAVLAGIGVPTLVIQGAADQIVRPLAADHIVSKVPGAQLRLYNGGGHAPHLESPQRFNRDLAEFVRSTRGSGGRGSP